ncbi:unnamed protein product [Sphagnum balticum]
MGDAGGSRDEMVQTEEYHARRPTIPRVLPAEGEAGGALHRAVRAADRLQESDRTPPDTQGNIEDKFIDERRRFLNYFCVKIAERPYMFDSDIFQTFIRGDRDFERAELVSAPELAIKNEVDYEYLKKVQKRLEKVR